MRSFSVGINAALLVVALAAPALAAPKILICYADQNGNAATQIAQNINMGNTFAVVDTLDCAKNTPSLQQLKMYDGVLVWDVLMFSDKMGLGNNLADYVDAGGGVVQAMFSFYTSFGQSWQLQGRWAQGNYPCLVGGSQQPSRSRPSPTIPTARW